MTPTRPAKVRYIAQPAHHAISTARVAININAIQISERPAPRRPNAAGNTVNGTTGEKPRPAQQNFCRYAKRRSTPVPAYGNRTGTRDVAIAKNTPPQTNSMIATENATRNCSSIEVAGPEIARKKPV